MKGLGIGRDEKGLGKGIGRDVKGERTLHPTPLHPSI